jgi:hypothetical protein
MAVFTPTITGLTSLTTENINIDNNSITALNSSIEQISYTSLSENFIKRSEEISNSAVWGILNSASVSADNVTDPNGTTTADSLSIATANNSGVNQTGVSSVTTGNHTFSLYVKRIGSVDQTARLLLGDGISSSLAGFTATSSWQRVSVTKNMASTNVTVQIRNADAGGVKTIAVWGAQVNSGSSAGVYFPTTIAERLAITGVTRGVSGSTAATASLGAAVTIGSVSTTLTENISATQDYIPLTSLTGMAASGSAVIGTSNMDLNLSASGTGSVTINQIKTNSVTGEVIPGKVEGTNFSNSLLVGHSTTGTLTSGAIRNTGVGISALNDLIDRPENTALGYNAMGNAATASYSTGIGSQTLMNGGVYNVAVGRYALPNASGWRNTAVGTNAGTSFTSGQNNILLGYQAGKNITSGHGNVMIGTVDAGSATGSRQLIIAGNDNTTTTTWLTGDSAGLVTMSGGISTPSIIGLTSLTTENINIDNNSITALNSSIEQVSYTDISQNLFQYSEQINNSYWTKIGGTITADSTTAPDGTTTADKFISVTTSGSYFSVKPATATTGQPYTVSIYAKAGDNDNIRITNVSSGATAAWFNLTNGTIGSQNDTASSGNTSTITDVGNGWYKCTRTFPASINDVTNYFLFGNNNADNVTAGPGSNRFIYVWGAQVSDGLIVTPYIKTTNAASSTIERGEVSKTFFDAQ